MSVSEQREDSLGELSPSLISAAIPQQRCQGSGKMGFLGKKVSSSTDFEKHPSSLHSALLKAGWIQPGEKQGDIRAGGVFCKVGVQQVELDSWASLGAKEEKKEWERVSAEC